MQLTKFMYRAGPINVAESEIAVPYGESTTAAAARNKKTSSSSSSDRK